MSARNINVMLLQYFVTGRSYPLRGSGERPPDGLIAQSVFEL